MEFFRIVDSRSTEEELIERLSLDKLEQITNEFILLEAKSLNEALIGGIWGEFTLNRQIIKGGLRFSLVECPNALTWTVTTGYPPSRDSIVIHLTINRDRKQQEFLDEIELFLDDHCLCLANMFSVVISSN